MYKLSTHVLNTVTGKPAEGVSITFYQCDDKGNKHCLKRVVTNADGRVDEPLLLAEILPTGCYELAFEVGAYFEKHKAAQSQPPFLSVVPIVFTIAEGQQNFHIPLLVSPWSYATYRGS